MLLLDGKSLSDQLQLELRAEIQSANAPRPPHLIAVVVGSDPASAVYVRNKIRACEAVGIRSSQLHLEASISQAELLAQIQALNQDPEVDGFIVQLPLPAHLDADAITLAIAPSKDVDGFHPHNLGLLTMGKPDFVPATPLGIQLLLERYQIQTAGKRCVVLGRSNIVGTPVSILLSRNNPSGNCTVTLAHSRTANLAEETRRAEILVVAIGKPRFLTADMVSEGAVVIDVGIHSIADPTSASGHRIVGDVDFERVAPKCSAITPVPKGVGAMTVTALLRNTVQAWRRHLALP